MVIFFTGHLVNRSFLILTIPYFSFSQYLFSVLVDKCTDNRDELDVSLAAYLFALIRIIQSKRCSEGKFSMAFEIGG